MGKSDSGNEHFTFTTIKQFIEQRQQRITTLPITKLALQAQVAWESLSSSSTPALLSLLYNLGQMRMHIFYRWRGTRKEQTEGLDPDMPGSSFFQTHKSPLFL